MCSLIYMYVKKNGREIIVQGYFLYFIQLVALQLLFSASRSMCAGSNRATCHVGIHCRM